MMDFSKARFDFVGRAKLWLLLSLIGITIGLIGIGINFATIGTPFVKGIDFSGGSIIQIQVNDWDPNIDTAQFAADVTDIVAQNTEQTPQVQVSHLAASETDDGKPGLILLIRADPSLIDEAEVDRTQEMYDSISELAGSKVTILQQTEIGAAIGKELTQKAVMGVFIGLGLILIYITIRLSFDFAIFAVIAMFHDVIILVGVFALFKIEINSPFVAVLLTVVGYSINDTIVIYDRIRENMKIKRHLPFDTLVNQSLLETMARTINTSGGTMLAILAILIFGGETLRTFMIGLGVGIIAGTYSSVFIASMLLVLWRLRDKKPAKAGALASSAASLIADDDDDLIAVGAGRVREKVEEISISRSPQSSAQKPVKKKRTKRRH